ncbi:MAG: class I SAM-dependent methyltransferase, partial [Bacteroidales bacterium]|nr:class I SAM-dependent methyltransferase [Bacteroidales bacterium]
LSEMGVDLNNVTRKDIARADEFHVRGAEVSRELAQNANIKNSRLLDIGCGIGGPCRMLADEFNCDTVGIDLSKEYVKTANLLSELIGLRLKTKFICADAINLPFEDKTFDVVWTQHIQMNVYDKLKYCSEINRVLQNNGRLIYYEVFKNQNQNQNQNQKLNYPLPWADNENINFLVDDLKMNSFFEQSGLIKEQCTNQTDRAIKVLEKSVSKIKQMNPLKLGLDVLMGETTKEKITNFLIGLKTGAIKIESGIYRKPEC